MRPAQLIGHQLLSDQTLGLDPEELFPHEGFSKPPGSSVWSPRGSLPLPLAATQKECEPKTLKRIEEITMAQRVYCYHLKKEAEGLEEAPLPGPLGNEILARVSQEAWAEWEEQQIKLVNEYRLDLCKREDRERLVVQLRDFLGLETPEGTRSLPVGPGIKENP